MIADELKKFRNNPAWIEIQAKCERERLAKLELLATPGLDLAATERLRGWAEAMRWNPLDELVEEKQQAERSQDERTN